MRCDFIGSLLNREYGLYVLIIAIFLVLCRPSMAKSGSCSISLQSGKIYSNWWFESKPILINNLELAYETPQGFSVSISYSQGAGWVNQGDLVSTSEFGDEFPMYQHSIQGKLKQIGCQLYFPPIGKRIQFNLHFCCEKSFVYFESGIVQKSINHGYHFYRPPDFQESYCAPTFNQWHYTDWLIGAGLRSRIWFSEQLALVMTARYFIEWKETPDRTEWTAGLCIPLSL
ncbi:hypothetical protein ACFL4L_04945 [bacterium]